MREIPSIPAAPCECPLCQWPERFEHKRGEHGSYKKSALFEAEICTDCAHDLSIFAYLGDPTDNLARAAEQLSGKSWYECCTILLQEELDWWIQEEQDYAKGIVPEVPDDDSEDDLPSLRTPEEHLRYARRQIEGLRQRLKELAEPGGKSHRVDFRKWMDRSMVRESDVASDYGPNRAPRD